MDNPKKLATKDTQDEDKQNNMCWAVLDTKHTYSMITLCCYIENIKLQILLFYREICNKEFYYIMNISVFKHFHWL
jgi:hypothetical protein